MENDNIESNVPYEVLNSLEDIKSLLDENTKEKVDDTFVNIDSERIDYKMKLLAYKYGENFNPKWEQIRDFCEGWHMIPPFWIRLLQGCKAIKFRKQTDVILNKVIRESNPEGREKGIFSILRPEDEKYGVLMIFHLD
jgi:hypothetical protein